MAGGQWSDLCTERVAHDAFQNRIGKLHVAASDDIGGSRDSTVVDDRFAACAACAAVATRGVARHAAAEQHGAEQRDPTRLVPHPIAHRLHMVARSRLCGPRGAGKSRSRPCLPRRAFACDDSL